MYAPLARMESYTADVDSDGESTPLREELAQLRAQEESIRQRLLDIDRACASRKAPFLEELARIRYLLDAKEFEIEHHLQSRVSEAFVPPGPESLSFVHGSFFDYFCSFVIIANLVLMVLELQHADNRALWISLDSFFLGWYLVELGMKFCYYQHFLWIGDLQTVWWNWLDLIIVVSGIVDQWVLPLIGDHIRFSVSSLRCLRLLRLFRIFRALRLLKFLLKSDFSWTEGRAFETFMMSVIVVNALVMWLELDFPWQGWGLTEHLLLTFYSFELAVRMRRWGSRFFCHREDWMWNMMDFCIVILGILEQWALPLFDLIVYVLYAKPLDNGGGGIREAVQVLRVVRVVRVLRLARLVKEIKPLHRLMSGLMEAMQAIGWVMLLTFFLLYAAAIVFTTLVGQGYIFGGDVPPAAESLYGSVSRTFLSLFKLMNDDQSVVQPIIGTVGGQFLFCGFMMVSNWLMLAILTSVVSDHMQEASRLNVKEDAELVQGLAKNSARRRMVAVFEEVDKENTGVIAENDFFALMETEEICMELLDASGLDVKDLTELFNYTAHIDDKGLKVILYNQFVDHLQNQANLASERTALHIIQRIRSMEHRQEHRLNKALLKLGVSNDEIAELPSMGKELNTLVKVVAKSTRSNSHSRSKQRHQHKKSSDELSSPTKSIDSWA